MMPSYNHIKIELKFLTDKEHESLTRQKEHKKLTAVAEPNLVKYWVPHSLVMKQRMVINWMNGGES